jgi:hypothetical protein
MNDLVLRVMTVAVFLGVGIWCLTQAKRMQKRAIEASNKMGLMIFRGYIGSGTYVVVTRVAGVICIVIALLLAVTLFRH